MKKRMLAVMLAVALVLGMFPVTALAAETKTASGACGDNLQFVLDSEGTITISGTGAMWDFRDDAEWYDYHPCPWSTYMDQIKRVVISDGVTYVGANAFLGCSSLTSAKIADSVTELGNFAFCFCEQLSDCSLPANLTSIGQQCFDSCALERVTLPKSLSFLDANSFANCKKLTYVYIDGDSELGAFACGNGPFSGCTSLTEINVSPEHFCLYTIDGVLYQGTHLIQFPAGKQSESFTIPSEITEISQEAFGGSLYLKQITIPESVNCIGNNIIFESHVERLRFQGDAPTFAGKSLWTMTPIKVYYPEGNSTWTEVIQHEYGAQSITWIPYSGDKTGWQQEDGIWYYYENGIAVTGWKSISGAWYYFNSAGAMQTGWQKISGTWYYFKSSGAMATGWQKIGGTWYYLKSSGAMVTGWYKISGSWYYFASSGAMQTGWQKISGSWYYLKSSGAMVTGWYKVSGSWYYFRSSGTMKTGWLQLGSNWYYLKSSGAMVTGDYTIGGTLYHFDENGVWIP